MRNTLTALTLAELALSAGLALGQDPGGPKTREQVRAATIASSRSDCDSRSAMICRR